MVNPQHLPSDGQRSPSVTPTPVKRSGLKWKFVLIVGGLGALLVIGALVGASTLSKDLNAVAFGVPSGFPVYPAAALVGVNETFSTSGTRVTASWEAAAPSATVESFYSERLNEAPWAITQKNPVDGTWEFRTNDGRVRGYLRLSGHGEQTRVDIVLLK